MEEKTQTLEIQSSKKKIESMESGIRGMRLFSIAFTLFVATNLATIFFNEWDFVDKVIFFSSFSCLIFSLILMKVFSAEKSRLEKSLSE